MALSNKHMAFVDAYITNKFNATEAYLSAYQNVTRETAKVNGSKLLTNTDIIAEIQKRKDEIKAQYDVTIDDIMFTLNNMISTHGVDNPAPTLKAIELVSKLKGYFAPVQNNIKITEQPLFTDDDNDE